MLAPIADRLVPRGLVILGELHGTHEAPAFVALAAERAASAGPVAIAVEIPDGLQPAIDAYLATGDRAALRATSHPFWDYRDGRGGEAFVALLDRARAIAAIVHCFDGAFESAEARDRGMAHSILDAIDRHPSACWLVSCGNLHARVHEPWMGYHLAQRVPTLVSLDIAYDGGVAWVCRDEGIVGITSFGDPTGDPRYGIELFATRDARGFDGVYRVGTLTASHQI